MNPRERVLAALSHKEPDKLPIDFGSTIVTAPTRTAYLNLREYLAMAPDAAPVISHRQMDTVYPREDFYRRYEVDFRSVAMRGPWCFEPREMPDDNFYDEFNIRWKKASFYYDVVERPLAGCTLADLDRAAWPDPYDPGRVEGLREQARNLYENTDYAIVADIMCLGPFGGLASCGATSNSAWNFTRTRGLPRLSWTRSRTAIALWDVFLSEVGDYVQVAAQGDDVGMQTETYVRPEMYRKFIKPRQRRIFDFIHSKAAVKVFFHSCGSVYDLIPDFIEIGGDVLNPIQRNAAKMDLVRLKREFGDDVCFWGGGIGVQQVLPFATL